jgi:hypothetical protein
MHKHTFISKHLTKNQTKIRVSSHNLQAMNKTKKSTNYVIKPYLLALSYWQGKHIVFRLIIEYYSSLRDFWPLGNNNNNNNNNRSIFI